MTSSPSNIPTKTPADTNASSSSTSVTTATQPTAEERFTLQEYLDKWKKYRENKSKIEETQPKEPSHVDSMKKLPVIGK